MVWRLSLKGPPNGAARSVRWHTGRRDSDRRTCARTARVDTVCGILIADRPRRVRLFDMGAPDQPTCPVCSKEGLPPGLLADVREALERADREPVEV